MDQQRGEMGWIPARNEKMQECHDMHVDINDHAEHLACWAMRVDKQVDKEVMPT